MSVQPAGAAHRSVRSDSETAKCYLGTMLESRALRWITVSQERLPY